MKISKFKLFASLLFTSCSVLFSCNSRENKQNNVLPHNNALHYNNNNFVPERNILFTPKQNDNKTIVKNVTVINKTVFIKQKRKNEKPTIRNLKPNKPKNNDSKKSTINLKKSKK